MLENPRRQDTVDTRFNDSYLQNHVLARHKETNIWRNYKRGSSKKKS